MCLHLYYNLCFMYFQDDSKHFTYFYLFHNLSVLFLCTFVVNYGLYT